MADSGTSQPSRAMNWLSVAAVLCLLGEIALLSTSARSAGAPPPVGVLALALLTLFFGAGSLIFPPPRQAALVLRAHRGGAGDDRGYGAVFGSID